MVPGLLEGKVAIVTGAAEGMGAATLHVFARAGAHVLAADVNAEVGEATVASVREAGGSASFFAADVSDWSQVEAMVKAAVERYGRLDCAVNNAGVSPDSQPLADLTEAEWDRVIGVNLRGVAICLKYELAQLVAQGAGGAIVNIGSVNSFRPQPNMAAYNAAKHGVLGLTKSASLECAPLGIRVNTICPGGIDTPMIQRAFAETGWSEADFAPVISLFNRLGRPDEVAQASLWLCSELSSYVTGVALPVDAGYTSR